MLRFKPPRSAYIHVPFCRHRCGYCNFTLVAGRDDLIEAYLQAIERELARLETPREVDTLFLGGGTPTHLSAEQLARLLAIVRAWHPLAAGHEFSVEANPADVDSERVALLAEHGVNRISLGAQSFDAAKLAALERDHNAAGIAHAMETARARIETVSLDLIFGTPGETLDTWSRDLEMALALAPDHISTYGLTWERGTTFWNRLASGEFARADEELELAQYVMAIDRLAKAGFEHYEVSNFALPGRRCRHNEAYWLGGGYYAAGPGAARYVDGRREMNHRSTTTWLRRILAVESPVAESETLEPADSAREALVFGLRRLEGIERTQFVSGTGFDVDELVGSQLRRMVELGLLLDDGHRIRLSREGLLVSDAIWPQFLQV